MKLYYDAELLNVSIRHIRLFSRILLNKKIDVNSIYKVNRRTRLILTFKSSASTYYWGTKSYYWEIRAIRRRTMRGPLYLVFCKYYIVKKAL